MAKRIKETEIYIILSGKKRRAKTYICPVCDKTFIRAISHVKSESPCCSRECYYKKRQKRVEVTCDYCGKKFYRIKSKIRKNKSKTAFCSRECLNNGRKIKNKKVPVSNYKEGHTIYRKEAFDEYDQCCSHCGYSEFIEGLDVHHIDGDRTNNNIENLIIFCSLCHSLVERGVYIIKNRNLERV